MSTNEYVPSDDDVRESYVHGETCDREGGVWDAEVPGAQESFTRWLAAHDARVARGALDGLAEHIDWTASQFLGVRVGTQKAQDVRDYRDARYPEENP